MTLERTKPYFLDLKAVNAAAGQIEGYASLFDVPDSDADVVARGAFEESLAVWKKSGRTPPLLWQHDPSAPIGIWTQLKTDSKGLFVRGQLFVDEVARAAEAYALVRKGGLSGLSIGYQPQKVRRDSSKGLRVLERLKLFEISLVTFPALESARITSVKSAYTVDAEAAVLRGIRALSESLKQGCPRGRILF